MGAKEKTIGLILIILGAWPFLLKISSINSFFSTYKFLSVLTPGEIIYQIIIIVLGALLFWKPKPKYESGR